MKIDLNWLLVLSSVVIPMLTALVAKRFANPGVKATVLAFLAAVAGILVDLQSVSGDFTALEWNGVLSNSVSVFLGGVGFHFGLLGPTKVTGTDGAIAKAIPRGVGASVGGE